MPSPIFHPGIDLKPPFAGKKNRVVLRSFVHIFGSAGLFVGVWSSCVRGISFFEFWDGDSCGSTDFPLAAPRCDFCGSADFPLAFPRCDFSGSTDFALAARRLDRISLISFHSHQTNTATTTAHRTTATITPGNVLVPPSSSTSVEDETFSLVSVGAPLQQECIALSAASVTFLLETTSSKWSGGPLLNL